MLAIGLVVVVVVAAVDFVAAHLVDVVVGSYLNYVLVVVAFGCLKQFRSCIESRKPLE